MPDDKEAKSSWAVSWRKPCARPTCLNSETTSKEANCIDGTVLFASLLEGASLSPAIVVKPGHAYVAWETGPATDEWEYLETTMIGKNSFEEACKSGKEQADFDLGMAQGTGNPNYFRRWPLRVLRSEYEIMPME